MREPELRVELARERALSITPEALRDPARIELAPALKVELARELIAPAALVRDPANNPPPAPARPLVKFSISHPLTSKSCDQKHDATCNRDEKPHNIGITITQRYE